MTSSSSASARSAAGGPPRRPVVTHLLALALVVGAGMLALATTGIGAAMLLPQCPGWASEGTIAAPESLRSQVLCTEDGNRWAAFTLLPASVLLLVALAVWWLRRRFLLLALVLVAASAAPLVVPTVVSALPGSCSEEQWARHGAVGCERDEELR